jgi:two-component system CheB/CheR fusion protein
MNTKTVICAKIESEPSSDRGLKPWKAPNLSSIDPVVRTGEVPGLAEQSNKAKGKGLNSIPIRFALMAASFTTLCALAQFYYLEPFSGPGANAAAILAFAGATIVMPAAITYFAANKLANTIRALRKSTEAIIAGDTASPVEVDCSCEVGGLADSFRAMVQRLNSNILRMNVLAYTDAVTGLPNRAVISHLFELMGRARARERCAGTMLFIDLDGFKRVNDTLGHEAGDELLRQVSDRIITEGFGLTRNDIETCTNSFGELSEICPEKIVFARFAGDEFVALLPRELDETKLAAHAGKIIEALGAPFTIFGNDLRIGASLGIARTPIDTEDPEELLSFADIAMYAAKAAGQGRYRFFDSSLQEIVMERVEIETDLRMAIERNELSLYYQPKLDTRTLELAGVEALVRWNHPSRGVVSPDRFISIAERSGLMPALGSVIFDMAAKQAAIWKAEGIAIPVAVNVSAVQFEHPRFVTEFLATLARHRVEPSLFEVEITETMIMSDFKAARRHMEQLLAAGVVISIDDFGTGYSNLSKLSRLPFGVIKIDKSLIDELADNAKSQAMVTAIIYMAHALGHKVVAEGVETLAQYNFLNKLGCDIVQGFLFGAPMSADKLREWQHHRAENPVVEMLRSVSQRLSLASA